MKTQKHLLLYVKTVDPDSVKVGDPITFVLNEDLVVATHRVEAVQFDDATVPVDGLFFLKAAVTPSALVAGLETENGHVVVDRNCCANLPGFFAAGDCTGRPYQYVKAAGEGNVAAHNVVHYLSQK